MNNAFDYEHHYRQVILLLQNISDTFSPGNELNISLPQVLEATKEHLGIERGMVTILNRKTSEIILSVSTGMSEAETAKGRYQLGEGITGTVVDTGKPLIIPDISEDSRFLNKTGSVNKKDKKSFICVPVKTTNEVIGA